MSYRLNKYKYPGAKRLMLEAEELKDKTEDYCAQPIDDNLFEWHFTVRGPPDTAFEGGIYHGRLSFPTEYPMKPPSIILLNPNGRFETNKKICLSISGFHPESWQPSWSVRTALLALIGFMPTKGNRAIGSLDYSDPERRKLAKQSRTWRCETCGLIKDLLKQPDENHSDSNCEASTSRVGNENVKTNKTRDVKSSSCDRDDSDVEIRDSLTDSQKSGTSSNIYKSDRNSESIMYQTKEDSIRLDEELELEEYNQHEIDSNQLVDSGVEEQDSKISSCNNCDEQPIRSLESDERRSFPPLVFISIFILLSLLILRRVVMILQS